MTEIPKVITAKWLRDHNACDDARELFKKLFGDSTPLTVKTMKQFVKMTPEGHLWAAWFFERLGMDHGVYCEKCNVGGSTRKALALIRKANG